MGLFEKKSPLHESIWMTPVFEIAPGERSIQGGTKDTAGYILLFNLAIVGIC
jgi:hypothetical protein